MRRFCAFHDLAMFGDFPERSRQALGILTGEAERREKLRLSTVVRVGPKGEGGSSPKLLGQAAVPPAASPGAACREAQAQPAITGEARARHARAMGAAMVRRDDLDVLAFPAANRLLVLDADIGEVDLVIEVRQVVFVHPFANLIGRAIRMAVVVVVVLVPLVEPALVSLFNSWSRTTRSMCAPRSRRRSSACSYAR